jgi:hypothetical protein
MSSEPTFKPEPEAPTIEMWHGRPAPAKADHIGTVSPEESGNPYDIRVRGDWQREQDRREYFEDLEERRNRPVHYIREKKEVNVVTELDAALSALEAGAIDFEQSYGKPNEP